MCLNGKEPLKVCHHSAKFGGHRNCDSEDILVLVCHFIFQDHVAKASRNWIGTSPSRQLNILPFWWHFRYWLHVLTTTTDETDTRNFCPSKNAAEKKKEEEKKKGNYKAFCVTSKRNNTCKSNWKCHCSNLFRGEPKTCCCTHSIFPDFLEQLFSSVFHSSWFQIFIFHDLVLW